ncbi:DUF4286 family protein [Segetibacter sp. 3557_3]|uniref:DUF4286 family protein n=1 Tax=Segetibacter sp. 3557_3 TaxID=2547429 RepID=UPI001058B168|nr:DUF4286 family protein [Segetibacter sp. 3557_3]TDH25202.1 DUF4286 family protein [Segetibacter sp. 3557_3]
MLVYNITTKVDWSVAELWLEWMLNEHVPEILGTGCFEKHQLARLLDVDDEEGPTYAIQYYASSRHKYDEYITRYSAEFRKQAIERWENKFIAFRSLMEIVV